MSGREEIARALCALQLSGRRLVRRAAGWAIIVGCDTRVRPQIALSETAGLELLALDEIQPAAGGGYVLVEEDAEVAARPGLGVLVAAGQPRSQRAGAGFAGLARRALEGEGSLSPRQAAAGLRFTADAEASGCDPGLSMAWDGLPGIRGRRRGGRVVRAPSAGEAAHRLRRIRDRVGEFAFAVAHAACVEGRPLGDLESRFGLARRSGAETLGRALEAVAEAYDG